MAESTEEDLFKFPRTRHLFDAGGNGVSRDDLLMDPNEEATFYSSRHHRVLIAVEEKVDGANLGISIGHDMKVYVQNRSHYINSKSHRQFSTLDAWLSDHSPSLYDVLEPGKHVLFGEWLYAKHSIHYTSLPGCFMAFDIYDRSCDKFYSWRERNRILETTNIPVVRTIGEVTINGRQEAKKLLETKSSFYDGPCEGVYLRVDGDMPGAVGGSPYLIKRAKLVRPDFLQQIEEQWTRQKFTKNIIKY